MAGRDLDVGRWLRIGSRALLLVGVLIAVLAVRVVSGSNTELRRGDRQRSAHDLDGAIQSYRRAAEWYAPGNPFGPQALDHLEEIARECEQAGDHERAIFAWRSVRGALYAARSFYVPEPSRLARANRAIARLSARGSPNREQRALARLNAPERPGLLWSLVALGGWIVWIAGALGLALRGVDSEDRVVPEGARLYGTAVVAGFGLFVLGLALA